MRPELLLGAAAAAAPAMLPRPARGAVTGSRCDADMWGRYFKYHLRLLRRLALLTALAADACSAAKRKADAHKHKVSTCCACR